jgi:threonine aldolase
MIDLRSDTVTKPTPGMRKAMYDAEVGDDCFSDDPSVRALEDYCAGFFNKEAALFTTGGTLSNQLAMKTLTVPGDEVMLDACFHINYFESSSSSAFSGVNFSLIHSEDGIYDVADMQRLQLSKCRWNDNYAKTKVVVIENTIGCKVGGVFPLEKFRNVFNHAKSIGAWRYLDGARILHAAVGAGLPVTAYTDHADLMAMCLSKGLGAPVGSILVGTADLIARARKHRKWFGGDMHQSGFLAAAALYGIKHHADRLHEDHENTELLFTRIKDMDEAPARYRGTNMTVIDITRLGLTTPDFVARLARKGVGSLAYNPKEVRFISHINISRQEIERAAVIIKHTVAELAAERRPEVVAA